MKKPRKKAPKDLLDEAKRIAACGDLEGAVQALSILAENYPDDIDARFTYASVLFQLSRYAEAAPHFKWILEGSPIHEWSSLGLFHSLWKSGREGEAIEEIKRFRSAGGDSMEYRRFFKDLKKYR